MKALRCLGYIAAALVGAPLLAILCWWLGMHDFANKAAAVWSEK